MWIIAKGEPTDQTALDQLISWFTANTFLEVSLGVAVLMVATAVLFQAVADRTR